MSSSGFSLLVFTSVSFLELSFELFFMRGEREGIGFGKGSGRISDEDPDPVGSVDFWAAGSEEKNSESSSLGRIFGKGSGSVGGSRKGSGGRSGSGGGMGLRMRFGLLDLVQKQLLPVQ